MDWLEIVLSVIVFIAGGLVAYFGTKSSVTAMVSYLIAQAEKTALSGAEKMQLVVGQLYEQIPTVFKQIFTREVLEKIAQMVFDYMKDYALTWAEKQDIKREEAKELENAEE